MERKRNPGSTSPPAAALVPGDATAKLRSLYPGYGLRSLQHPPRKPQRDFRNIRDQHQNREHHPVERPDAAHHLLDRHPPDRAADEQDRADRRLAQADAEIEHHDHAEMDRVDAE